MPIFYTIAYFRDRYDNSVWIVMAHDEDHNVANVVRVCDSREDAAAKLKAMLRADAKLAS